MSDYNIVIGQFKELWRLSSIPLILSHNTPKIRNDYIGELSGKFTYKNYYELYNRCLSSRNYQILIQDESMISMYYAFSSDGEISRYNLSFIPSLNNEIDENNCDINSIIEDVENYMRIDFDIQGYEKIFHEKQHLHLGLNNKSQSNEKNVVRLPVAEKLYPWDFIFLILKLIYHLEDGYDKYFNKHKQEYYNIINVEDQIFHIKFKR
ncbi:DUF2290 domain-containing protein [Finegoldia magna]|uniref:DUF2290 domain-containing protein n=1 Tax=Finegoldia magna TaxID=1260 RepID=UPI0012AFD1CF|nr:DUF2290 domain-containing protein [Finegoldia magna]MSB17828.1 DUF2290 domain-containing protein [Finegoldia magna]MSD46575.1 DUF2290 domain-containing protein [Finegoldia magna]